MRSTVNLILASKSAARQTMLRNAGLTFQSLPADIDEHALITDNAEKSAEIISSAKAQAVSKLHPDALVIGSDQVLVFEDQIITKSRNKSAAIEKLNCMSGRTHRLISGASVACNGKIIWSHTAHADLTMHDLDDDFIQTYADQAGDVLTACVGGYAYEAHGAWLFERVEGDYFTILGMPLLPLLSYLRTEHGVSL